MTELLWLLLGFLIGFLTAVVWLRPDLLRSRKSEAEVPKVKAKLEALIVSEEYVPQHVFTAELEEATDSILRAAAEPVSEWQQFDIRDGVTFSQKEVAGQAVPLLRGDATIDAPALGLLQLILDDANGTVFDPQLKRFLMLEHLDDQSDVIYTEFSGIGPVSGRDFCVLRHYRQVPGALLLVNTSIEYPGCAAVQGRGNVRGTTPFNGWILRPMPGSDGMSCSVTFLANVCVNGSLPKYIIRKVAREAPEKVLHLKRLAAGCSFDDVEELQEQQQKIVDRGREVIEQLEGVESQKGWELVMTKHEIKIYRKKGSLHMFKGEGIIKVPAEDVQRALLNVDLIPQWDSMCRESGLVARIDDNTRVVYLRHEAKKCLLKSGRDFCLVHSHVLRNDGSFALIGASIEHPKCPHRSESVRAELSIGGWTVTPTRDRLHSHVTHVVEVDFRGGIPQSLVDMVAIRLPLAIHYLDTFLTARSHN